MTDQGFVTITGDDIADVIKGLRATERQFEKARRLGNREVAEYVVGKARANARAGTPMERHFADVIAPAATPNMARLRFTAANKGQRNAGAYGTFYGAKKYAQFRQWVGASWAYARRGEGPYVLNATVADEIDVIGLLYQQTYEKAFDETFMRGR